MTSEVQSMTETGTRPFSYHHKGVHKIAVVGKRYSGKTTIAGFIANSISGTNNKVIYVGKNNNSIKHITKLFSDFIMIDNNSVDDILALSIIKTHETKYPNLCVILDGVNIDGNLLNCNHITTYQSHIFIRDSITSLVISAYDCKKHVKEVHILVKNYFNMPKFDTFKKEICQSEKGQEYNFFAISTEGISKLAAKLLSKEIDTVSIHQIIQLDDVSVPEFIQRLDISHPKINIIGKRGAGKSWLCLNIIHYLENINMIDRCLIIAPTDKMNPFYETHVSPNYTLLYEYSNEKILNFININQKENKENLVVLLDDCISSNRTSIMSESFKKLIYGNN